MHILHSAAIVAIGAAFSLAGAPNDFNAIHSQRDEIYANGTHRPNIEMKLDRARTIPIVRTGGRIRKGWSSAVHHNPSCRLRYADFNGARGCA